MAKKKKKFYVNPKELHQELMDWKNSGEITDILGQMFLDLTDGLATMRNFSGYTWIEEMKGKAIEFLIKYSKNYNPEKANANAFAYCTTIIRCAFIQTIQRENKHTDLRKDIYEDLVTNNGYMKKNVVEPLENFNKNNANNRIDDDIINDLIEDYDIMIDILREENRIRIQNGR